MNNFYDKIEKQEKKIISELNENLNKIIDIPFNAFVDFRNSDLESGMNIMIRFADKNSQLEKHKSPYFNKDIKSFIHFTSFRSLFSIINEKAIRLYNLNNSNDDNEYSFTANNFKSLYKSLGDSDEAITRYDYEIKDNSFILSFTDNSEICNIGFWRKYADKNKGVAIEFTISNNALDWDYGCFISNVKYVKLKWFNEFSKIITDHKCRHPNHSFTFELDPVMSFHKEPIKRWIVENEMRILITKYWTNSFREVWDKMIYQDYTAVNKKYVKYLKLPLYSETEECSSITNNKYQNNYLNNKLPKLKITKIFIGTAHDNSYGLEGNINDLKSYFLIKFGYSPKIERIDLNSKK